MQLKFVGVSALLWAALAAPAALYAAPGPDLLRHVDPRIGVLGDGATVIGPAMPFGSIHPSPDTIDGDNDGYKPDRDIRGFSQLHVSGTGWGQYGNFMISPQVGLATLPDAHDSPKADERAEAHQYKVTLARYDIVTEVAPTARAAIYRFTFPRTDKAHLVLDVLQHLPGDIATFMMPQMKRPVSGNVTLAADGRSLSGQGSFPGGFGGPYTAYFYAELDRAPSAFGTWRQGQAHAGKLTMSSQGSLDHIGAYMRFDARAKAAVQMKIGVSFLSVDKARQSLKAEIPGWRYGAVRDAGAARWRSALDTIAVKGGSDTEKTIFYTALYHAQIMPRDRTGEFARFGASVPMFDDHYAIWDTWRTLYPLLTLIRPDMVRDTVNSFIERQRVDGTVPDSFIAGVPKFGEQGGNGTDMIIADAHARGITGVDWTKAYEVMKHNADQRRTGAAFDNPAKGPGRYRELGWIPAGIMSTSMSLEYAYNDFAAAQLALALGYRDDAKRYGERSRKWTSLWNPDTESDGYRGFTMPRSEDGTWIAFDTKKYPGSWKPYFYEANAWTYSYFAPHQVERLVGLMGGRERFIARLEHALEKDLIALFNEPSFLIPQLFHYVGRPDLAAKWMHKITGERFTLKGYPGDDDSGAMSSYYIWGKLGLFPNAGQDLLFLNGPAFDNARVKRPGQAPLEIAKSGNGIYIASVTLDGKPLTRSWLRHTELNGKTRLAFVMSDTPTSWATMGQPPPSLP